MGLDESIPKHIHIGAIMDHVKDHIGICNRETITKAGQMKEYLRDLRKIHKHATITLKVLLDGFIDCSLTIGIQGSKSGFIVNTITSGSIENAIYETCLKLEKIHADNPLK